MKLSAPIYQLKRKAKILSREERIPLHQALDRLAAAEGFGSWSLLSAKHAAEGPAAKLYSRLTPGDMLLIAARPSQGKTLLAFELVAEAAKHGDKTFVFSMEYTKAQCHATLQAAGLPAPDGVEIDCSDTISAQSIIGALALAPSGTFAVVDYLQILDQRRDSPDLMSQIRALKAFAKERGITMAFISQINRRYDPTLKAFPEPADVNLPNPLDLKLFDRFCFLNEGQIHFCSS